MRMYKPSKFPDESSLLSVTLGRAEQRPAVYQDRVVARRVAPLFVRADHRVTDAHVLAQFISTLRGILQDPQAAELQSDVARPAQDRAVPAAA
jgi:pyruvate/2-oxoglutarate dehydrogenase complex dihydrolipoamide acyltransferase (E2) component